MRVTSRLGLLLLPCSVMACGGDHYEGGGRRNEVPSDQVAERPNIGSGESSSSHGGSTAAGGTGTEAQGGEAGVGPTPGFAGAAFAGGSGGTFG